MTALLHNLRRPALLAPVLLTFGALLAQAANPIITSIYTADPSAHVWSDGRLYVYPSRDIDPPRGCDLMDRYHVFSTADMVHWRDEGEILRASQVPWGRKEGGFMWAPDCAYRNGTYYYYFPHPSETRWNDTWKIGVATSTKPASDFKVIGYLEGLGGFALIDPAVFVDTDGQAYIYYGGGGHCKGAKLKANMIEIEGSEQAMTGLVDFHEASWVFKRNDLYYLTYSDNLRDSNRLCYATSQAPLGPWKYQGVYLEPTGCDTSHGSVTEYKGQWYAFYHNKSLSGRGNLRSICVDKLEFNPDGTIQTVKQTKTSVPAVGPAPGPNPNALKYGVEDLELAGGTVIGEASTAFHGKSCQNLHLTDAAATWKQIDGGAQGGQATLSFHYATEDRGKLQLIVNEEDYSFLNIFPTGGWDNFSGQAILTVPLKAGKANTIQLKGGQGGVNIDCLEVAPL